MKKGVFSVFDEKARTYFPPFFLVHKGEAIRTFSDIVNDPKSIISRHPEDYKLYSLGTFDDVSGKFESIVPEFMNNAVDFLNPVDVKTN